MTEIAVKAPPELPKALPANPVARLLPVVMLVAAVGMMAVYFTSGAVSNRNPMFVFFPVMMVMSVLGTLAYGARGGAGRSAEIDRNRRDYLRYLGSLDSAIAQKTDDQRRSQCQSHPEPRSLWEVAGGDRRWERRAGDRDFCRIRVGIGEQPLCTTLSAPELGPAEQLDPVTVSAMRTLIRARSVLEQVPVSLSLDRHVAVTIGGDPHRARALVRAMVCQLAVWHGPGQVSIAVVAGPSERHHWDWVKWLPHHQHWREVDAVGAARLVYDNVGRAVDAAARESRHTVVLVDGAAATGAERLTSADGVTVVAVAVGIDDTVPGVLHLHVGDDGLTVGGDHGAPIAHPDSMTPTQAATCARRLASYRPAAATADAHQGSTGQGWLTLMGVADAECLDPEKEWTSAGVRSIRPVPLGISDDGAPVVVDINEAARNGIGPHGLCVGATGSGKSELLRTLVLGMVTAHPPDVLNLVLVDFKGGATFLGLERARHVAAVITNLADEAHLVARMNDALAGEVHRRQELLRAAGNFANVTDYELARSRGAALPALPALFIVVDEFSELLSQHPDFAELFVAIGRLGRSLGIHLLLASQRLDEGRLRGLETHLSYRICLKTFSASESRAVLGVPDAHHLPGTPGAAYLKTAAGEVIRFQTAFVSGPCPARRRDRSPTTPVPVVFTSAPVHDARSDSTGADDSAEPTVLDVVLGRVAGRGAAAHPVWLPPLVAPPTLDQLMRHDVRYDLRVPIGLVDNPFEQRHDLLVVDLAGAAGNVAIVGAPRSGKSTAVRTLMLALAEAHDPADVAFHCLDFGGGTLSALHALPHVGSVAGSPEGDLCRRTVAVMESLMREREARFRRMGIESIGDYRTRRAAGDPAACDDPYGDVFLVVDGWATLRRQFDALEAPITAIAAQGLTFGVHVVLTAARWAELRPALKDQIATRVELRLGDPAESEMDRRRARLLVNSSPGRGLTAEGREMTVATPRWDGTAERLRRRWPGRCAPRVELLPTRVALGELISPARGERHPARVVVGLGERDLRPVTLDFGDQPHLLVLGEPECGKTSVLRLLCEQVIGANRPEQVQLEIVDFRRTLLGVVESGHLSGYAASPAALSSRLPKLVSCLEARLPGDGVTQQQLRDRSWWSGPEIYLVVDDYDLVAAATGNPMTPLADILPHAKDLGLHVVVARRSGGAARAMFDPVLARLRELGCMGLLMSASPDEGALIGSVRPLFQPPGRGTLVTRRDGEQLVQVGWTEPP